MPAGPLEYELTKKANKFGFSKKRIFKIDEQCYNNQVCKEYLTWENKKGQIYGMLNINSISNVEENNKKKNYN